MSRRRRKTSARSERGIESSFSATGFVETPWARGRGMRSMSRKIEPHRGRQLQDDGVDVEFDVVGGNEDEVSVLAGIVVRVKQILKFSRRKGTQTGRRGVDTWRVNWCTGTCSGGRSNRFVVLCCCYHINDTVEGHRGRVDDRDSFKLRREERGWNEESSRQIRILDILNPYSAT